MQILDIETLVDGEHALRVLAVDGQEPVAFLQVLNWDQPGVMIYSLYVDPIHRNKGVAKQMVAHAMDRAKQAGKLAVSLTVKNQNEPALRLYKGAGFRYVYDCGDDLALYTALFDSFND